MRVNVRKQFDRVRKETAAQVRACERSKESGEIEDTERGIRIEI